MKVSTRERRSVAQRRLRSFSASRSAHRPRWPRAAEEEAEAEGAEAALELEVALELEAALDLEAAPDLEAEGAVEDPGQTGQN